MFRRLVWTLSLFFCAAYAFADVTGTISGSVKDPSGAVIPGASVEVVNRETGVKRSAQTNSTGGYSLLALPVGQYRLTASHPGFKSSELIDIVLDANSALRFDLVLTLGSVDQMVEVTTSPVQVEVINTQMGDVIEEKTIETLPLDGRTYTDLLGLQPGVAPASAATVHNGFTGTTIGAISVSGQRETANNFQVNGGSAGDPLTNGASVIPNLDSIAEFRLLTNNFNAEYGHFSGGIINVITKSGTNKFHGSAFEFLRNEKLDARNFFDDYSASDHGRGLYHQNQFGGTLGGPVVHNKVFSFVDYQGSRQTIGQSSGLVQVPSEAEHNGQFDPGSLSGSVQGSYWAGVLSQRLGYTVSSGEPYSFAGCAATNGPSGCVFPGGSIPGSAFSSPAQKIAPLIVLPNENGYFVSNSNTVRTLDNRGGFRLDAETRLGTLFGYYFLDNTSVTTPFGQNSIPGFPTSDMTQAQQIILGDTKVLRLTEVNEFRLNYTRFASHGGYPTGGLGSLSSFGFVEGGNGIVAVDPIQQGVPYIGFNDFSVGLPGTTFTRFENTYQVLDNFTFVRGPHTVKFGGEFRYVQYNQRLLFPITYSFSGAETGSDFADFIIGAPDFFYQITPDNGDGRTHYVGIYGQDSWRLRSDLTLNYGLRWDLSQPWYDTKDRVSSYVSGLQSRIYPTAPTGYVFPGDPGVSRGLSPTRWNNFGPRIGVAYSPSVSSGFWRNITGGPGKSSIRASYGLFYTSVEDLQQFYSFGEPPYTLFYFSPSPPVFETPFINRVNGASNGQRFPFVPIEKGDPNASFAPFLPISSDPAFATNNFTPYAEHYSLSIQRQIGDRDLLTLSYVGTQGHHLLINLQPHPGIPSLCQSLSNPANLAPGTQPCGPFGEDSTYVTANGSTIDGTRGPQFPSTIAGTALITSQGNSAYNAFEASLRHSSGPLNFLASYTFSKSLDLASSSVANLLYPYDLASNRSLSQFDAAHNFVVSYDYSLPFDKAASNRWPRLTAGWSLAGITHLSTGFPVSLQDTGDRALLGGAGFTPEDRPNYSGGPLDIMKNAARTGVPYFDVNQFTRETVGQIGTSRYRFFHGPGTADFDTSLLKDLPLTDRLRLQFRAEFFNVFNHTQFTTPSGNVNGGTFGIITSAASPRIGQFAVKLFF